MLSLVPDGMLSTAATADTMSALTSYHLIPSNTVQLSLGNILVGFCFPYTKCPQKWTLSKRSMSLLYKGPFDYGHRVLSCITCLFQLDSPVIMIDS